MMKSNTVDLHIRVKQFSSVDILANNLTVCAYTKEISYLISALSWWLNKFGAFLDKSVMRLKLN